MLSCPVELKELLRRATFYATQLLIRYKRCFDHSSLGTVLKCGGQTLAWCHISGLEFEITQLRLPERVIKCLHTGSIGER